MPPTVEWAQKKFPDSQSTVGKIFLSWLFKRVQFLLKFHHLQSVNVYRVEQIYGKRGVVARKFPLDKRSKCGGMNLRVKILQAIKFRADVPIQHGITIIGMLAEKFYVAHDFAQLVEAVDVYA